MSVETQRRIGTDRGRSAEAGTHPLGEGVRVVSRRTVVDGTVRHELGFERRPGA